MFYRVVFALILLFWLAMNALLLRSEFGAHHDLGSTVPIEMVWQRILAAPDDSALEISVDGKKIGYCRWKPTTTESSNPLPKGVDEAEPEGMVRHLFGYKLDFDGSLFLESQGKRLRFSFHGEFATNNVWKAFRLEGSLRPLTWRLEGVAADANLVLAIDTGEAKQQHQFTFEDLRHPEKVLREFGLALPMGMLPTMIPFRDPTQLTLGLQWEARQDWLTIGHSKLRVYRVQARLLGQYQVVAMISRIGEVLRLELPNGIVLLNDALINF